MEEFNILKVCENHSKNSEKGQNAKTLFKVREENLHKPPALLPTGFQAENQTAIQRIHQMAEILKAAGRFETKENSTLHNSAEVRTTPQNSLV